MVSEKDPWFGSMTVWLGALEVRTSQDEAGGDPGISQTVNHG